MKKLILLALAAVMVAGCTEKDSNGHILLNTDNSVSGFNNPSVIVIDSCEYISWGTGFSHKGNCKHCAERRKQELEEFVNALKRR